MSGAVLHRTRRALRIARAMGVSRALWVLVFVALFCHASWGRAVLYRGSAEAGSVASIRAGQNGVSLFVCAEDVGALLGFSVSREGDELRLTGGGAAVRFVTNAAAAWRGFSLVSLRAVPFERDGRFWIDAASAALLFQPYAGSGPGNRLRFVEAAGAMPSLSQPRQPAAAPAPTVRPDTAPEPAVSPVKPEAGKKPAVAAPDPRRGTALRIRWGSSTHKIRSVVDLTDGAEPDVMIDGGKAHALFASSAPDISGLSYPFENVEVSMVRGERGVELDFSSDAVRVEKMMLNSPRRLVLDFHFTPGTAIAAAKHPAGIGAPPPIPTPAPTPAPAAPAPTAPRRTGKKLVVVDPGHGGKDPGAAANGVREKDVNLAIGLELEKALQSLGFDVVMTRRTDVYLKLQERTDIANDAGADVFVSVHVNALPSAKKTTGFEIYIMALPTDKDALALAKIENREYVEGKGGNSEDVDAKTELLLKILGDMQQNNKINESTGLAEKLFEAGKRNGLPMRRVAQAPFFVLRGAGMPAVLLETGFVTNATEAKLLAHPGYRERIAQAMARGVADYLE